MSHASMNGLLQNKKTLMIFVMFVAAICFVTIQWYDPNEMELSILSEYNPATSLIVRSLDALDNKDKLHLVVIFYNILDGDWVSKNFPPEFNLANLEDRMAEIVECLRQNLNHSMVATVHFLDHDAAKLTGYFQTLDLPHQEKLFVHEFGEENSTLTIADYMRYASVNLQGRVVVLLNSDCCLGEGFDKMDMPYLKHNNVVYALTRHWVGCKGGGSCAEGDYYLGSHDAYIFHLRQSLPEVFLEEVNIEPRFWNIESHIIGAFHYTLNQTVLNPCKILKVMHHHCSGIRPSSRQPVPKGPHFKLAEFSGLYTKKKELKQNDKLRRIWNIRRPTVIRH